MRHYEIEFISLEPTPTIATHFRSRPDDLGARFLQVLPHFIEFAEATRCRLTGSPFARYLDTSSEVFDMEIGLPVASAVEARGVIVPSSLPAGPVAATWHIGRYEELGAAHDALRAWAEQNGRTEAGGIWEQYLADPGDDPSPEAWRTRVYLPLA